MEGRAGRSKRLGQGQESQASGLSAGAGSVLESFGRTGLKAPRPCRVKDTWRDNAMADRFLIAIQDLHELRRDIETMSDTDAEELIQDLGDGATED